MRLGELLVNEQLVSPEELATALEAQGVHGGRLGTNLIELGLLQESDLARVLGRQHGLTSACGELEPERSAIALVDARLSDAKDMVPLRLEGTRLTIAVLDPRDIETLDSIAFRTGKRVIPVVVPEFRLHQLLRRHCQAYRPMRPIDLTQVPELPELLGGPDPFQLSRNIRPLGAPIHAERQQGEPLPLDVLAQSPAFEVRVPLSFEEASHRLMESQDREDVAHAVLRYAVGRWRRVLLLALHDDLAVGWYGAGEGIRHEAIRRIALPLTNDSTFALVRKTRCHFVGPLRDDLVAAVFFKMLGGDPPRTAVLLPLLAFGQPVHMLYLDDGPDQVSRAELGEMLILAQAVPRAYEQHRRRDRS
jgi:hypothetical protein